MPGAETVVTWSPLLVACRVQQLPGRRLYPEVRLVGVDTVGPTIFRLPARPRLMRGLGSSIHPRNVAYENFSEVHRVAPGESVWACGKSATSHYATGGWSVGAVALVAGRLTRTTPASTRIVTVFPDGPQRYLETVHDDVRHVRATLAGAARPGTGLRRVP